MPSRRSLATGARADAGPKSSAYGVGGESHTVDVLAEAQRQENSATASKIGEQCLECGQLSYGCLMAASTAAIERQNPAYECTCKTQEW